MKLYKLSGHLGLGHVLGLELDLDYTYSYFEHVYEGVYF